MRSRRFAVITGRLVSTEPLTVAEALRTSLAERMDRALAAERPEELPVTLPVAQDPDGRPIVRGTSVAGALRAHLAGFTLVPERGLTLRSITSRGDPSQRSRPATLADLFCGSEPEELLAGSTDRGLRPSAVRVVDVSLIQGHLDPGRTRTAISRERGAAVANKLFRRGEVREATLEFLLQVDLPILEAALKGWQITSRPGEPSPTRLALADLVTALHAWQPRLGGRVSAGYGAVTLEGLRLGIADPLSLTALLTDRDTVDMLRSVSTGPAAAGGLTISRDTLDGDQPWQLTLSLVAVDPLLIAPTRRGQDADNAATTADVVPGSSWRGVIRARSEFILRSCGIEACLSSETTCGSCPTCHLFGWAPRPGEPLHRKGSRGLIRFLDSPINGQKLTLDHAPIDRFTGGAADAKLFTRTSWAPSATLTLTIEQIGRAGAIPGWARALVTLAVRDLHDGLIGIGNATTRGYGTLAATHPELLAATDPDWLLEMPAPEIAVGVSP